MNLLSFSGKKSFGTSAILLGVSAMVVTVTVLGLSQKFEDVPVQHMVAQAPVADDRIHTQIKVGTAKELRAVFEDHDYTLEIPKGAKHLDVPRLELVSLPSDLAKAGLGEKKTLFLRTHLPLIMKANEKVLEERERLLALIHMQENGFAIRKKDAAWLVDLAKRYGLKKMNIAELKHRVDVIPPSLALGQAVVESGWGVSHAARGKNSTFGMMTRSNRVMSYESLQECVDHYVLNLNRHEAYRSMRRIRSELRRANDRICSIKLADGLHQYSTRGQSYVREVKNMIRSNSLNRFDGAYFRGDAPRDAQAKRVQEEMYS